MPFHAMVQALAAAGERYHLDDGLLDSLGIDAYIDHLEQSNLLHVDDALRSTAWAVDARTGVVVGAAQVVHPLTRHQERYTGNLIYQVHPRWRSQGVGRALMQHLLATAHRHGLPSVLVVCDSGNTGSRRVIGQLDGELLDEVMVGHHELLRYLVPTVQDRDVTSAA